MDRIQLAALIAVAVVSPTREQSTTISRLPAPDATLRAEFGRVGAVRQLADGRILVADEGEYRLHVATFATGEERQVGREGSGAGEYRAVRRVFPVGPDSSLVGDVPNGRWLLVFRDSIVATLGASLPAVRILGPNPLGADSSGGVIATRPRVVDGVPRLDSLVLVRGSRRHARIDTLGTLLNRMANLPSGRIDPTRPVAVSFNPLAVGEQVAVFEDGWVAIARLRPYLVEWIAPDRKRIAGSPLPFDAIAVDDREKAAALERESRATGRAARAADAVGEWPATVPAFLGNALLAGPGGTLWIQRTPSRAQRQTRYDVVDRSGTLVRRVAMDESERIVGFGPGFVYTVRVDADGLERLRRHRSPR